MTGKAAKGEFPNSQIPDETSGISQTTHDKTMTVNYAEFCSANDLFDASSMVVHEEFEIYVAIMKNTNQEIYNWSLSASYELHSHLSKTKTHQSYILVKRDCLKL